MNAATLLMIVAGAIVGGFISHWLSLYAKSRRRPRLEFQTGSEAPFVVAAPHNESPTPRMTWIRVRVRNHGWRDAKSCRVYLTDLSKDGDKRDDVILKDDALALWASNGGDGDMNAPLTISRGFARFYDIAYFLDRDELKVSSSQYDVRTTAKLAPGVYLFGIAASGANFDPVTAKIEIRFDVANGPVVVSFR
jgi:hypothetical protein